MVRLNKIYTRKGDQGKTQLGTGLSLSKHHARIEACGNLDEINASLGLVQSILQNEELKASLMRIQNDLFDAGADLTIPQTVSKDIKTPQLRILQTQIDWLEEKIDQLNQDLEPLDSFILPGGTEIASRLHLARTICRRAERQLSYLMDQEESINPYLFAYINRLSDFLFVAARWANHQEKKDIKWTPGLFQ